MNTFNVHGARIHFISTFSSSNKSLWLYAKTNYTHTKQYNTASHHYIVHSALTKHMTSSFNYFTNHTRIQNTDFPAPISFRKEKLSSFFATNLFRNVNNGYNQLEIRNGSFNKIYSRSIGTVIENHPSMLPSIWTSIRCGIPQLFLGNDENQVKSFVSLTIFFPGAITKAYKTYILFAENDLAWIRVSIQFISNDGMKIECDKWHRHPAHQLHSVRSV